MAKPTHDCYQWKPRPEINPDFISYPVPYCDYRYGMIIDRDFRWVLGCSKKNMCDCKNCTGYRKLEE